MSPLEAKLELLRQSVRLGYVGKKSFGLQLVLSGAHAMITTESAIDDVAGPRDQCRRSPPTTDEPAALPGRRHRIGHGVVWLAVWRRADNRVAAKMEIRTCGISVGPSACIRGQCANLLGGGHTWAGGDDHRGARHGGLFRRRRDGAVGACHDDRRLGSGAAIRPGGSPLDLIDRHRPRSHEAQQNVDAAGNGATAILPAPDAPRADTEHLGDAVLSERAKGRTEFGRGHWRVAGHNDVAADLPASGAMIST